ncbi:MAG: EAL domain-containing protein [Methylococcaceae bacterium]
MNNLPSYQWSDLPKVLCIALLYAVAVAFTLLFLTTFGHISIIWLPSGFGLAMLLMHGYKIVPSLIMGALLGYFCIDHVFRLWWSLGNTLEPLVVMGLLKFVTGKQVYFNTALTKPCDYLLLAFAGAIAASVAACLGVGFLWQTHTLTTPQLASNWLHWWMGDFLGIVVIAPLLIVWREPPYKWYSPKRLLEACLCFGLTLLFGQVIFFEWLTHDISHSAYLYTTFLFITWSALRFGRHGVLVVVGMTAIQALLGALQGTGLFAYDIEQTGLVNFWFYIMVLTVVGLSLALSINTLKLTESSLREQKNFLNTVLENEPECVKVLNLEGKLIQINRAGLAMLEVSSFAELQNMNLIEFIVPDDREAFIDLFSRGCLGETDKLEFRVKGLKGTTRWLETHSTPLRDEEDNISAVLSVTRDISQRKQAELTMQRTQVKLARANEELQLAALVYQYSSEGMIVTDDDNAIITVNPAFTAMTGYTLAEIVGKNPNVLSSGRQDIEFYQHLWHSLNATGHWRGEIWNRRKNGEEYAGLLTINTIFNSDGSVHRRVALFSDITEKKKSDELIWQQANFDVLTGLPNRRQFHERLAQEINKAQHFQQTLGLMFLDLDHFKEINDTLGHDKGDNLLQEAARRLQQCVRTTDIIARLGGDEFVIIFTELDNIESLNDIAQKILNSLTEPFCLEKQKAYISVSIGIALYPNDALQASDLIKNADQAMYASKNRGRNRHSYFEPVMQEITQHRMQMINDLRPALIQNQFRVFYQPIVSLSTGTIHKAEALIRWQHPKQGLIYPNTFIPLAEETGMIINIGDWVFREAAKQVAQWRITLHPHFQISINKSPIQFRNALHAEWFAHLQELGLLGQSIIIEITEGILLDAQADIINQLIAFRSEGIEVSLDDFGTGYSSLAYLKKFSIDYLKIDQSFVRNLATDINDLVLCEAIIVMAHKLGIKVIAEGIENQAQLDLLMNAGCDYGQGYLFSKPIPAQEFEQFVLNYQADKISVVV